MRFEFSLVTALMLSLMFLTGISIAAMYDPIPSDAEGYEDVEFGWYDKGHYKMHLSIPVADIDGCKNSMIPHTFCILVADHFVTEDTTVRTIAEYVDQMTFGRSDVYKADFVNNFVYQCIEYKDDAEVHGHRDYYQYPVETLLMKSGDCEDMSILTASILRAMGYDAILLMGNDHCIVGVDIPSDGRCTEVFGKRYYHLDPTTGNEIGISDDDMVPWLPIYIYIASLMLFIMTVLCLMILVGMVRE